MKLTAEDMLNKFSKNTSHPKEVQRIASLIFEEVNKKIFETDTAEKKYLEIAALLHDIGYYIDPKGHNKYSMKMIMENGLDGLNHEEEKIVACICRYHRGSLPDKIEHEVYNTLDKRNRKIVKRMGGILKLADGLDPKHKRLIREIKINFNKEYRIAEIIIVPEEKPIDLSSAIRKRDLFEIGFKCQSILKVKKEL